ncbi:hypothetical protein [Sulfurimonas autotrophica]|uniref:Uncharacterized protein n=1 Tax=Sulfurimonas autotrophica (strain ATCC BAA-671 / DSM 16294 / JCM 11897 / OK10) TaxID=563040 RepID=E0UTK7_SULAO|nr:hypothetical protein [Sulfurimonas autotrophica]ADN08238.1 hypothetical protein Saut_0189 [Sulfurimonas autotrophica DSM 16294]
MQNAIIVDSNILNEILLVQRKIEKKLNENTLNENTPNDELVTVKQAHIITKISEQKIRQMMIDGELETNDKYGTAKRIYRRSL